MMMLLWVLAIGLGCTILSWIWEKTFKSFVIKTPELTPGKTVQTFVNVTMRSLLSPAVGRGADAPWADYGRRVMSRTVWLMSLAVSNLNGLLFALIPAVVLYVLSTYNVFLPLSQMGRGPTPPDWIFWLSDGRPMAALQIASAAFVLGLAFRSPYLVGALAWIFLFPGFLSLTGFVALQLGERLGLRFWRIIRFGRSDKTSFRDWGLSFAVELGVLLLALFWNPVVQDLIAPFLGGDGFNAFWRFIQAYVLLLIWVAVETLLALGIFHFYAKRS